MLVANPIVSIRFDQIEMPISKICQIKLDNLYTIWTQHENSYSEGYTKNDAIQYAISLNHFYSNTALPFFKKFNSLDKVWKEYLDTDRNNLTSFLTNSGNLLFYRELILNSKYDIDKTKQYYEMINKELEPYKGKEVYKEIIENLETLYKSLSLR